MTLNQNLNSLFSIHREGASATYVCTDVEGTRMARERLSVVRILWEFMCTEWEIEQRTRVCQDCGLNITMREEIPVVSRMPERIHDNGIRAQWNEYQTNIRPISETVIGVISGVQGCEMFDMSRDVNFWIVQRVCNHFHCEHEHQDCQMVWRVGEKRSQVHCCHHCARSVADRLRGILCA